MLALIFLMIQDGSMAGATTPEGVVLRWAVMKGNLPKDGYEVWRREGSGEFAKVAHVKPMSAEEIKKTYGEDMALSVETMISGDAEDAEFQRAFLALLCETQLAYAKAMGWYHLDATAAKGRKFTYEVRVGPTVLARSKEVEAGGEAVVPIPARPTAEISDTAIVISWEKLADSSAYHVYRAVGNEKLVRLTKDALVVMDPPDDKKDLKPTFGDPTAKDGEVYTYAVTCIDSFGRESKPSERVQVGMRDITPPPLPMDVKAEVKDGKMVVTWKAVDAGDLAGYNLYRTASADVEPTKMNKDLLKSTTYIDEALKDGEALYILTSVDKAGNESSRSTPGYGKFRDQVPPAKVVGVKTFPERGKITVAWDPIPDKDLSHYILSRSSDSNPEWIRVADMIKETRYTDVLAESLSEKFRYRIRALDTSDNEGPESEIAEARLPDVTPPPAPILIRVVGESGGIKIVWETRGHDVAGVFVERADKPEGPWIRLNKEAVQGSEYKDEIDRVAWYSLVAVDGAGNASERSNVSSSEPVDRTPPAKVTGLTAAQDKTSIKLSWNANEERDLAGYILERRQGDAEWRQIGPMFSQPGFTDRSIRVGLTYSYRVAAYDRAGNRSEAGDAVSVEVKK